MLLQSIDVQVSEMQVKLSQPSCFWGCPCHDPLEAAGFWTLKITRRGDWAAFLVVLAQANLFIFIV